MFTLRQYLTTLADTHGLTKTLGGMEVCRDSRGRMCYTVGNSAIVFRVRHEGHIRSLRCYMHPPRHLAEIYGERLLPQELYLYDSPRSGVWVDVVLGDWIEGATLHEAVAEAAAAEDATRLGQLAAAFDRLAARLTSDDWAHGDLKPENIVVDSSGRLHLIDLDAMYLPAFAGEASPELGTAAFQHPARTIRDFNASLDDYPAALISTALHALALDPTLYVRYPDADGLLFSPQQIRTDEALREAIALFEREGLAVQYRIARLLYAPTPRLFGLPELLAWAARTGGPPCGGREGEETTGHGRRRREVSSRKYRVRRGQAHRRRHKRYNREYRVRQGQAHRRGHKRRRVVCGQRRRRTERRRRSFAGAVRRERPVGLQDTGADRHTAALRLRIRLYRRACRRQGGPGLALHRHRRAHPDTMCGVRSRKTLPQRPCGGHP